MKKGKWDKGYTVDSYSTVINGHEVEQSILKLMLYVYPDVLLLQTHLLNGKAETKSQRCSNVTEARWLARKWRKHFSKETKEV